MWSEYEQAAVGQMLAFLFIGEVNKNGFHLQEFVERTEMGEVMATLQIFDHQARLRSYELFSEVFK